MSSTRESLGVRGRRGGMGIARGLELRCVALCVIACALGACGGARRTGAAREDESVEPIARTMPGASAYEVLSRTRVTFGEHELATVRTRMHLFVEARHRRGLELRARVFRLGDSGEADAFSDVELELDRRGGFPHEPLSRCDDPDIDDLAPTRLVRQILGSLAPWDGSPQVEVAFGVGEIGAEVTLTSARDEGEVLVRGSGTVDLGSFSVAGWRIRADGDAHVEVEEHLDPGDALVGRSRIRAETVATVMDRAGRTRSGLVEIRSETVVRASDLPAPSPENCDAGFSPSDVLAAVELRRAEIRRCYETALGDDPALHGRLGVSLTVLPLGEVDAVHVTTDELGVPAVGECVVGVLSAMRFVEGPVGDTRFELPFAFSPEE